MALAAFALPKKTFARAPNSNVPAPHGRSLVGSLLTSSENAGALDSDNDSRDASLLWQNAGLLSIGGIDAVNSGTSTLGLPARIQHGPTLHPLGNGQDDTPQINAAIANAPPNSIVKLGPGTFILQGFPNNSAPAHFVRLMANNITLRGSGAGATILLRSPGAVFGKVVPNGAAAPAVIGQQGGQFPHNSNGFVRLTANARSGSTTISVASASNFNIGDPVCITEQDNSSWQPDRVDSRFRVYAQSDYRVTWPWHSPQLVGDFPVGTALPPNFFMPGGNSGKEYCPTNELHIVTAISGNTLTLDTPLAMTYRVSNSAQAGYYSQNAPGVSPFIRYSGIENVTLSSGDNGGLWMTNAIYCWIKDCEIVNYVGVGVELAQSYRCEIEGCYIHHSSVPVPGGGAYAFSLSWCTSQCLIHNSIMLNHNKAAGVMRSSGTGSVVAYNYLDAGYIWGLQVLFETGLNGSHMCGSHHSLWEGNVCWAAGDERTWGNAIYHTRYRNWIRGMRSWFSMPDGSTQHDLTQVQYPSAIRSSDYNYWTSYIGNVIGYDGVTTVKNGWSFSGVPTRGMLGQGWAANSLINYGFRPGTQLASGGSPVPSGTDPFAATTTITTGNFCYITDDGQPSARNNGQGTGQAGTQWDSAGPQNLPPSFFLTAAPAYFTAASIPWPPFDGSRASQPIADPVNVIPAFQRYYNNTPVSGGSTRSGNPYIREITNPQTNGGANLLSQTGPVM